VALVRKIASNAVARVRVRNFMTFSFPEF